MQALVTAYFESGEKPLFGATVYFPEGIFLVNLPLFEKIPNMKFFPALAHKSYFTYVNEDGATIMLLEGATPMVHQGLKGERSTFLHTPVSLIGPPW